MISDDLPRFTEILAKAMRKYSRPMPEATEINEWFTDLSPWPLMVVAESLATCIQIEPRFPPNTASVIVRCRELDRRPSGDEAWATALESQDEAATVVWTQETAEATGACQPILDARDKYAARKSFLATYERLVVAARIRNLPVRWVVSIGRDKEAATLVLEKAVRAGQLAIENVSILLPAPTAAVDQAAEDEKARVNLRALKDMIATGKSNSEKMREARDRSSQAERDALMLAKQVSANRVCKFLENNSSAI